MAEEFRNEVTLTLGGQERTLRATFSAIRAIERDLGKSIVAVINAVVSTSDLSVTDMAVIVHHGLRGALDTRMSLDEVGDAVVQEGFDTVAPVVIQFLSQALKGASVGKPKEAAG